MPETSYSLDYIMCNPPFYESTEEMLVSAQQKRRPPNSVSASTSYFPPLPFSATYPNQLPNIRPSPRKDSLSINKGVSFGQACTGAEIEMVTPGGEVAFVHRLIAESIELKEQVQWYTSMLGKHSSVATIIDRLREVGVHNWAVTEFVQGTKTRRWAVAWSWRDLRPRKVCFDSLFLHGSSSPGNGVVYAPEKTDNSSPRPFPTWDDRLNRKPHIL